MKQSIDWLSSNELEMASTVFAELNFVQSIVLFSDKCSPGEIQKMETEFALELEKNKLHTHIKLSKYLKAGEK